jgi:quercetin dioxygenase-like cupin family protein
MRVVPVSACLLLVVIPVLQAQPAPTTAAQTLRWGPVPAALPAGAKMAVVSGDPSKKAPFTVQVSMPAGYKVPPHFHPTAERVEVKSGTVFMGMGDVLDVSKAQALVTGRSTVVPAKLHHFAVAKAATVLAITAMGPFAITYVNPADDPQAAAKK